MARFGVTTALTSMNKHPEVKDENCLQKIEKCKFKNLFLFSLNACYHLTSYCVLQVQCGACFVRLISYVCLGRDQLTLCDNSQNNPVLEPE